jgi:glycerol-3-phosphate dehydrogenase
VSREHEVFVRDDGMVIVAGGKLTTYRIMAKEVVRKALKWMAKHRPELDRSSLRRPGTRRLPLPGAEGLEDRSLDGVAALARELAAKHQLSLPVCEHLTRVYGVRASILAETIEQDEELGKPMQPDLPYVWAEIDFAVSHDLARTIDDVLSRRVPLLLVGRDQGLDVLERIADRLQHRLGWSAAERERQVGRYRKSVADSRRFRSA